jgi:FtsZ-interacting cell division protein YlmF
MSMLANAARGIKNIWSHGDDDDYMEDDDMGEAEEHTPAPSTHTSSTKKYDAKYSDHKYSASNYTPSYGGGSSAGSRPRTLRSVPIPLRAREKNIYTLRPKTQDEAAIAADYLKAGSAVVVNLESVDTSISVRIIDFMSGVCYGLEGQGHAMKLGDSIFLFTPGEFEISSDELDYGENRDFFFKDVDGSMAPASHAPSPAAQAAVPAAAPSNAYTSSFANSYNTPQQYHNVTPSPAPQASASSTVNPSAGGSPLASNITRNPTPQSVARAASEPRAHTVPASSVYGTSGKAHVTIGGRPAPTTVMSPAPRSTSGGSTPSGGARSWER